MRKDGKAGGRGKKMTLFNSRLEAQHPKLLSPSVPAPLDVARRPG